jgi:serine/threonine-protein kinase
VIGQLAGNYKILSELGEGGMGTVYKAVDVMLEREVAIKMLRPEIASQPQIVERFRSEAVTLAKLNHPSIATLYSFFRQGDHFFMVMEYVVGQTLDAAIRQSGALPPDRAVSIMTQALDGIAHAHEVGILHRDLKPANIMLPRSGGVKVMDFGIARLLSAARMTRTGGLVGTLEYVAPERVRGQEADLRSDLYSMGIVLYEMLSGRVPFQSDTEYELMRAQLEQAPPSLASLGVVAPAGLEAALIRALAKNPEERFASAAEFRTALLDGAAARPHAADGPKPTRLAAPVPVGASLPVKETRLASQPFTAASTGFNPTAAAPARAKRRTDWKLYGGAAAAVAVLAAGTAFWVFHKPATRPAPASAAQTAPASTPSAPAASNPPTGGSAALPGALPPGLPDQSSPTPSSPGKDVPGVLAVPPESPAEPSSNAGNKPSAPRNKRVAAATVTPAGPRAGGGAQADSQPAPAPIVTTPPPQTPVVQTPPPSIPPPTTPLTPIAPVQPQRAGAATLQDVRTLFIEPMANDLNVYIAGEIQHQLGGRIQVVSSAERADAIMAGTTTQRAGGVTRVPGRVIGVQTDADASVVVTDRSGMRVLWRDEAASRSVLMGVVRKGGPHKLAEHLVSDLKRVLR